MSETCYAPAKCYCPVCHEKRIDTVLSETATSYTTSPTGMLKHGEGKLHIELVPADWIVAIAQVMQYGAYDKKPKAYGPGNWMKGGNWSDLLAAAFRHALWKWFGTQEDNDAESGHPHLVHAAVNLLMLYTQQKLGRGTDDRAQYNPKETT